jgi:hypothetical protein
MTQIKKTPAKPVSPPVWPALTRVPAPVDAVESASFNTLLQRTIALSRSLRAEHISDAVAVETAGAVTAVPSKAVAKAALPAKAPAKAVPSKAVPAVTELESGAGADALADALRGLAPDAALKLRTLMLAGRDARDLTFIHRALTEAEQDPVFAALDLGRNASQLFEYLRRGHAIACATRFDLETPIDQWPIAERPPLGERVWARFGKELALSDPSAWECLGVFGSTRAKLLSKLYLRVGKEVWWSFGSLIDRPSPAVVKAQQKARAGRGAAKVGGGLLRDVIKQECEPDKRALRRAIRAIEARLGSASEGALA